jgi:hypothetical protein
VAIDAMHSASNPHAFMGVTEQGLAAIVKTRGNQDVHVILRGGTKGPNYSAEHVKQYAQDIEKKQKKAGVEFPFASLMVDCSRKPLIFPFLLPIILTFSLPFKTATHKKTTTISPSFFAPSASSSPLANDTLQVS